MEKRKRAKDETVSVSETESKRIKVTKSLANKDITADHLSFLSHVKAFILKAGIEKTRLQIFENQLQKYGGSLLGSMEDATHLVVDDKMEPGRLCRLLKLERPPNNVSIVKSGWLSACFKTKSLVHIDEYLLDCADLFAKDEQAEIKGPSSSNSGDLTKDTDTAVSTIPKLPRVGFMFGHKAAVTTGHKEDEDSDYCPSDEEGRITSNTDDVPSLSTTSISPKKNLPVSVAVDLYFY